MKLQTWFSRDAIQFAHNYELRHVSQKQMDIMTASPSVAQSLLCMPFVLPLHRLQLYTEHVCSTLYI